MGQTRRHGGQQPAAEHLRLERSPALGLGGEGKRAFDVAKNQAGIANQRLGVSLEAGALEEGEGQECRRAGIAAGADFGELGDAALIVAEEDAEPTQSAA